MERYFNNFQTTVAPGGYTNGSGVLNVLSTAGITLNAGDTCRLSLYTGSPELVVILIASAVNSGTQFAVTAEGTDVSASASDLVLNTLTIGGMNQIRSDISLMGAYSTLPVPGSAFLVTGQRFKQTDGPYEFIYNGTIWVPFMQGYKAVLPVPGAWSFLNQGGATVDYSKGFGLLAVPASGALELRAQIASLPATPFIVDAMIAGDALTSQSNIFGIGFYDSGSGKLLTIHVYGGGAGDQGGYQVIRWTNVTTFSASVFAKGVAPSPSALSFVSIQDDGTNLNFFVGTGVSSLQVYTDTVGDWLTPDHVVWLGNSQDSVAVNAVLLSWYQH